MECQSRQLETNRAIPSLSETLGYCWSCGFLLGDHARHLHIVDLYLPACLRSHKKYRICWCKYLNNMRVRSSLVLSGVETAPKRLLSRAVRSISPGGFGFTILHLDTGSPLCIGSLSNAKDPYEEGEWANKGAI